MKKFILMTILTLPIITTNIFANDLSFLSTKGSFLGLINTLSPVNQRSQFDFAANIDFTLDLDDNLKGIIQLQSGAGQGSLGFVGPETVLTDINLEYTHQPSQSSITFGSFDLPFGKGVNYLSNNADPSKSPFILNSLTYSALAGPVGTLNTLGIKLHNTFSMFESTLALTNGTGENASNYNQSFLYLLSLGMSSFNDQLFIGGTYTASNDKKDPNESNSFKTNFSGWLLDLNVAILPQVSIKNHIGQLIYDDGNDATQDRITITKSEISYTLNNLFIAGRYSYWRPENNNGNSTGASADIKTPGLSLNPISDTSITRWQVGAGYSINSNTSLRADIVLDDYQHISDVKGVIVGINSQF